MTDQSISANEWATPALSSSTRTFLSRRRDNSPHSKGRSSTMTGISEGHEGRSPPVAQVLPNTPNKSRTLPSTRQSHELLQQEPKNLFHHQDMKYSQYSLKEMHAVDLSYADHSYGILNEEDTLNQSVLEADTELKRRDNIAVGTEELRSGGVGRDAYTELTDRRHRDFELTKPANIAIATAYSHTLPRPPISVGAEIQAKPSYLTTDNHEGGGAYYSGGLSTGYAAGKQYDLQSWQQHMTHQQSNPHLQTHLEHLHLSSKGLNTALSSLNLGNTNPSSLGQDIGSLQEPSRLSALIHAKDNILQEKNIIIDKQKLELSHFEEQIRELQALDRHRQYTRATEEGDMMLIKIQEYQYEISSMKAQLAEVSTTKAAEVETLNRTLGEREYEIDQIRKSMREGVSSKQKENEDLRKKLVSRESRTDELKSKFERLREKYEKAKRKESSYNSYLQELPTMKDHRNNIERLKNLKEKETLLTERIGQLESSLAEVRKAGRQKDTEVNELQMSVESYKEEISKLQIAIAANGSGHLENIKCLKQKDVDDLQKENNMLRSEVDRLKRLVESKHGRLKSLHEHNLETVRTLEGRIEQDESTVHSLREAIHSKDRDLERMQASMRQLAAQSQEMYEHNLNLTERCQELEKVVSVDYIQCSQQLMLEISACVADLQCLVHIVVEQAEGKEPDMSMLLGVKSMTSMLEAEEDGTSAESIKNKLKQVQQLQAEINTLRSMLSDKYAEDLGDQCITQ